MVYSNRFVMCVLVDGKVAQELANGTTIVPFGSEYVLRFRNKNDRRAVVKFSIDGEEASGTGYIIPANSSVDIKRYAHKDVAFKFVDLESPEAIEFGKNGDNKDKVKGVIEACFYLEKQKPQMYYSLSNNYYWTNKGYWKDSPGTWGPVKYYVAGNSSHVTGSGSTTSILRSTSSCQSTGDSYSISIESPPNVKDGATVEGSQTGQYFTNSYIELESDFVVLKTFLQGFEDVKSYKKIEQENQRLKEEILQQEKLKMLEEENKLLRDRLERLKKQS